MSLGPARRAPQGLASRIDDPGSAHTWTLSPRTARSRRLTRLEPPSAGLASVTRASALLRIGLRCGRTLILRALTPLAGFDPSTTGRFSSVHRGHRTHRRGSGDPGLTRESARWVRLARGSQLLVEASGMEGLALDGVAVLAPQDGLPADGANGFGFRGHGPPWHGPPSPVNRPSGQGQGCPGLPTSVVSPTRVTGAASGAGGVHDARAVQPGVAIARGM